MAMKIVILEDDERRAEAMRDRLADRFRQFDLLFFDTANEMKEYLESHFHDVIAVSLDHDLELKVDTVGQVHDPGTGREIADYLAGRRPSFPVIIHSTNSFGAIGMESVLQDAGWETYRVSPFDDLQWVHDSWFPAIRRAIVRSPRKGVSELGDG
jgi:hypothetical protein